MAKKKKDNLDKALDALTENTTAARLKPNQINAQLDLFEPKVPKFLMKPLAV